MSLVCAILDDYQQVALSMAHWDQIADTVSVVSFAQHFATRDALVDAISDADIVVLMRERTRFDAVLFGQLPRLELLVTTGMRNAAIDLEAAKRHGVIVSGTDGGAQSTAELTWALILGLARSLVQENAALRNRQPWQSTVGIELADKKLGILGLGRIGSHVARIGLAFGMKVSAWSQNLTPKVAESIGVEWAPSKDALLKTI